VIVLSSRIFRPDIEQSELNGLRSLVRARKINEYRKSGKLSA
jgi:hypothetical protein